MTLSVRSAKGGRKRFIGGKTVIVRARGAKVERRRGKSNKYRQRPSHDMVHSCDPPTDKKGGMGSHEIRRETFPRGYLSIPFEC